MEIERRFYDQSDSRVIIEDRGEGKKAVSGLGIVFNKRSINLGGFVEVIKPEAVEGIDWNDVVSMTNHDPNFVMGRSPKTMTPKVTSEGVEYHIEPSEDTDYKNLVIRVEREDIKGSSFGFTVEKNGEDWAEDESGVMVRTITKFRKIYDLSPVVFPAYKDTDNHTKVAKRSMEEFKNKREEETKPKEKKENKNQGGYPVDLAKKRLQLIKTKNKK